MQSDSKTDDCRGWEGPAVTVFADSMFPGATVFSSPHSGRRYPESFLQKSRLSPLRLRASEDAFVDLLFREATRFGSTLVTAEFPRAYLDANRAEDELDPALIAGLSSKRSKTMRVTAGLGVVPRIVAEGAPIYDKKISMEEVQARIETCHRPYHRTVQAQLQRARKQHGVAYLIDCHSMPSGSKRFAGKGADIVIGDCYGASASAEVSDIVFNLFRNAGFSVARNVPFAGGFITQHYGKPEQGVHSVQIEIDRGLYLDQRKMKPVPGFEAMVRRLSPIIAAISALPSNPASSLAAE